MLQWDVYEITSKETPVIGVMCRGRIRKFCIKNNITILLENAVDKENTVRFALQHNESPKSIQKYIQDTFPNTSVTLVREKIVNPVLSKLQVNIVERYEQ